MKKAILLTSIVIFAFLFLNTQARAEYDPQLHIISSMSEAETYESVLIMITSDPIPYNIIGDGNNETTIHSNHTIELTFYNLGTSEVIYNGTLTLKYGTATWSFMVVPEWGEFTGIVEISDPLIDSTASVSIKISYSTDYIIHLNQQHDEQENEKNRIAMAKAIGDVWNASLTIIGFLLFFTFTTLIKLDHTTKTKIGEESLWERFYWLVWPFNENTSKLTMYARSEDYRHPTEARKRFEIIPLMAKYNRAERDEEDVLYRKEAYKQLIEEIDPEALPATSPDMTVQDLQVEMHKQMKEEN